MSTCILVNISLTGHPNQCNRRLYHTLHKLLIFITLFVNHQIAFDLFKNKHFLCDMRFFHTIVFVVLTIGLIGFSSCNDDPTNPEPIVKEPVNLTIKHYYNTVPFKYNEEYMSPQGTKIWFTMKKYYLSNVIAVKSDGKKELIADVVLIHPKEGAYDVTITGSIPKGSYTKIMFDLGVRQDLNEQDPATWDSNHPLSVMNNMYWTWGTQYVFSKLEGFIEGDSAAIPIVYHTGTEDLYRPEVTVPVTFNVETGGGAADIHLDIFNIIHNDDYTFDFKINPTTHTMDHKDLAVQYMDNFVDAFPK